MIKSTTEFDVVKSIATLFSEMELIMLKRIFFLSVVAMLLLTAFAPLAASKKTIIVHNDTEEDINFVFEGPETYKFTVKPGKFEKTMVEGDYEYSYKACDGTYEGEFTVEKTGQWFVVEPCEPEYEYTKFVVYSHFDQSISIDLVGPEDYTLKVELGKNKFVPVASGEYIYSYDICDTTFTGLIKIKKNGSSNIMLKNCERLQLLEFGKPNPIKMLISNRYSIPIDVTLIGPLTYYATIQPGLNRLDVISGTYTYIYAAYGTRYEGTFIVGKKGDTVVFLPTVVTVVPQGE
jgi:hypothetical protein